MPAEPAATTRSGARGSCLGAATGTCTRCSRACCRATWLLEAASRDWHVLFCGPIASPVVGHYRLPEEAEAL